MPEAGKDAPKAEKPAQNRAILIIAAALFVVGLGAGFGSAWLVKDGPSSDAKAEGEGEGEGEEKAAAEGEGHGKTEGGDAKKGAEAKAEGSAEAAAAPDGKRIVALGDFIVNLKGTGGARVLRMQIQAMGSPEVATACTAQEAPIRDAILTVASDYTYTDVEGLDGKVRLRDELLRRINGIIRPAKVENLYFTAFVVQ